MAQVISLRDALHARIARSCPPPRFDRSELAASTCLTGRTLPNDEDIDRAILLLGAAAERARLLATQASDPSSSDHVEAQAGAIVQLLGLAHSVTSRLE